jgi:hypothetical protein
MDTEIQRTDGVHSGARELLVISLIWFGYITRLFQWEEGGSLLAHMKTIPAFAARGRGRGSQHPVVGPL